MNKILWLRLIGISGAVCVMLGAFAAHGLEGRLSERYMDVFQTAVFYQLVHTLALLGLLCLPDQLVNPKVRHWAAISFALGILIFSGSLYLLVFTHIGALGMITPIGGSAFIVGWLLLFFIAKRDQ
ncbi:MAG: DUF423 domain-containing protein [Porticoccaceae bacterium]|jgi:uncharacterized membrane protein YgdD (TMEM256/DUF423 family)|nr:DUF423 domain-containing protein [Porticoccaceae bacterium]